MAKLIQEFASGEAPREHEERSFADVPVESDFEDLIYSWGRLADPGLRRLAVRFIRMLGEDSLAEQVTRSKLT